MERYKRPILYDPKKTVTERIEERREPAVKNIVVETPAEWLKSHPLFNVSGLSKEIGIDPSNFHKQIKMGTLPKEKEESIINILKQYGYGKQD